MTTRTTTGPILSGRDIGITYQAIAAVREQLLAEVGLTFEDSIQLSALIDDGAVQRAELVAALVNGLKIGTDAASVAVDALTANGLAREPDGRDTIAATTAGVEAHERFNTLVSQLAPRLYGGIPTDDLAAAKRVLDTVAERANRQLELTA